MWRRLFIFLAGMSALLCTASIVLWIVAKSSPRQWVRQSMSRTNTTEMLVIVTGTGWTKRGIVAGSIAVIVQSQYPAHVDNEWRDRVKRPGRVLVNFKADPEISFDRDYSYLTCWSAV